MMWLFYKEILSYRIIVVGAPLAENIVRLIITLKLISLGRGSSGVQLELINLLENMLKKGVIPVISEKGSVGASGDLAPLAHMVAVIIGEGESFFQNIHMSGGAALKKRDYLLLF